MKKKTKNDFDDNILSKKKKRETEKRSEHNMIADTSDRQINIYDLNY
jgi:hypothetical protein